MAQGSEDRDGEDGTIGLSGRWPLTNGPSIGWVSEMRRSRWRRVAQLTSGCSVALTNGPTIGGQRNGKSLYRGSEAMTSSIEASYRVGNDKTLLIPGGKDRCLPRDVGGHESFPSSPEL
ncbi:hypothetical protein CEXT_66641 [Caerostris extrusa]|uniref:Uncharacterized protein n=1 Tax=Caerostris extrusa TaxID=172846 RepID=A0AAV4T704_CAEEX|nr:hypothetical protein CEXT_66641 [Caerostris extrusa]